MTTITNTMTKTIRQAMLASIVAAGTVTAFTSSAQAMVVYNCVAGKTLYVRLRGQTTRKGFKNLTLRFGKSWSVDTGRGEKFRIIVGAGNARKSWSNHNGGSAYSIRKINGNIEISKGRHCQPKPQPIVDPPRDDDGDDSEQKFWKPRYQGVRLDARLYREAEFNHPSVARKFCKRRGFRKARYRVATSRTTIGLADSHVFRNGSQSNTAFSYIHCSR